MDLFTYPMVAGAKERSTSFDAAVAIETTGRAETLRIECLAWFKHGFVGTADQLAHAMNESILSVRPRCSELHIRGLIEKTGRRCKADGGRAAHCWRAV